MKKKKRGLQMTIFVEIFTKKINFKIRLVTKNQIWCFQIVLGGTVSSVLQHDKNCITTSQNLVQNIEKRNKVFHKVTFLKYGQVLKKNELLLKMLGNRYILRQHFWRWWVVQRVDFNAEKSYFLFNEVGWWW